MISWKEQQKNKAAFGGGKTEKKGKGKVEKATNKVIKVKIRKSKESPASAPLFSQKDVRRVVTEFVSSWIRGDIVIHFPTAAELSKKNPLAIAFPSDPSVNQELKIKEHYVDLLLVCAGITPASNGEKEKAITDVYKMMLMFRSANRIEGKIISNDLERRIDQLEEKLQSTSRLVEQITAYLFKGKKPEA
ncbi:MAG: hypothetical protein NWF00_07790 [Candidatus Bathyarchaeota archaeon]|nr:hypothetical protein [Candidatus Bathyarchaeota archaeon]